MSGTVILMQTIAFAMCLYETVQYSRNLSSADEHKHDPSSRYLLAASLLKMVATLLYWGLRKYEDIGAEQKSEQYRKSLENYAQEKVEKKHAKEHAWIESVWIIADCKGKIDRLRQITNLLKELSEIEIVGEQEEGPRNTYRKIGYLADDFKRILAEIRKENDPEEVDQFLKDAENSINDFSENHILSDLNTAVHNAEKAVRLSVKEKLYATQVSKTVFDITLS